MRLHGYCTSCHRPRLVTAANADAMLAAMRHGIAVGTCDECADETDRRQR